jgi:hypothetical protein
MRDITALATIVLSLLCVGCKTPELAVGIYVKLLKCGPDPFPGVGDRDGLYVMTVMSDRSVRLWDEKISFENLGRRMEEVFRTRSERLLLVRVGGGRWVSRRN